MVHQDQKGSSGNALKMASIDCSVDLNTNLMLARMHLNLTFMPLFVLPQSARRWGLHPTSTLLKCELIVLLLLLIAVHTYGNTTPIYSRAQLRTCEQQFRTATNEKERIAQWIHLATYYNRFNCDTAAMYGQQMMDYGKETGNEWLYHKGWYCRLNAQKELKPLQEVYPKVEACFQWFTKHGYKYDALLCRLILNDCGNSLYGASSIQQLLGEQLAEARDFNDAMLMAEIWNSIGTTKPYHENSKYAPSPMDSAAFYFELCGDSARALKAQAFNLYPKMGSPEMLRFTRMVLTKSKAWGNSSLMSFAHSFLGVAFIAKRMQDSALYHIDKSALYAQQRGSVFQKLMASYTKTYYYLQNNRHQEGLDLNRHLIEQTGFYGIKRMKLIHLLHLVLHHSKRHEYESAIQAATQLLTLSRQLDDRHHTFQGQIKLANLYRETASFQEAKAIYKSALPWIKETYEGKIRNRLLCDVYSEFAKTQIANDSLMQARILLGKSLEHIKDQPGHIISKMQLQLMEVLVDLGDIQQADSIYQAQVNRYGEKQLKQWHPSYHSVAGRLFIALKSYDKGVKYLETATAKSLSDYSKRQQKSYFDLSKGYEALGKNDQALDAYRKYSEIKDSLTFGQSVANVVKLQKAYELSQKQQTIDNLEQQKQFDDLQLSQQEGLLKLRQAWIIILVITALLVLTSAGLFYRRLNQRKEKEKYQLEIQALEARQENELLQAKNALFENVSHEFRTPLTLIQIPLMRHREQIPATERPLFDNVLRNVDELLLLVNDLLQVDSTVDAKVKLDKQPFDLVHLLRELEGMFASLFDSKHIAVYWELAGDLGQLHADEKKVRMVMNNLLKNAFAHTPANGKVKVEARVVSQSDGAKLFVSVYNTGAPISNTHLNHVFDRFYRGENPRYTGSGIGLGLSKEVVEAHDGNIGVSNDEQGVLFYFTIPGITAQVTTFEKDVESPMPLITDQETKAGLPSLLIVEDNIEIMQMLTDLFAETYHVLHAYNGAEGYKIAHSKQPSLILSDIMMPVKNGFELLQELKSNLATSHIPVVLLTAKGDAASKVKGLEFDADAYLAKPFHPDVLQATLTNIRRQRKRLQEQFIQNPMLSLDEFNCTPKDALFIKKARKILEKHYQNEELTVEEFCSALALNRNSVHNKLKAFTGENTSYFIRNYRLEKAVKLLSETDQSITEVWMSTGFKSAQVFSKAFKNKFKLSPSQYRSRLTPS